MFTTIVLTKAETNLVPDLADMIAFRACPGQEPKAAFELGLD